MDHFTTFMIIGAVALLIACVAYYMSVRQARKGNQYPQYPYRHLHCRKLREQLERAEK